jgi:DNA-binding response OmpR family regulator
MNKRILVIEDDINLSTILQDTLTFEGFAVDCVADGARALDRTAAYSPDLILLDLTLPNRDGFELCDVLHRAGAPIIILSARSQQADKLRGLDLGADDYLTKPFDLEELLARIRTVLRRLRPGLNVLRLGELSLDFRALTAMHGGRQLHLSHREFEILRYLAERAEQVVSRSELLNRIWRYGESPITRSVDQAIARLRKKIEANPRQPRFIHTVHGDGYCLTPDGRDNLHSWGETSNRS